MDLYAYAQIDDLDGVAKANGIDVPRLRGYRLMENSTSYTKRRMKESAKRVFKTYNEKPSLWCPPSLVEDRNGNWHSQTRREQRLESLHAYERTIHQLKTYNKYCGRSDVLYIHARIGGGNWNEYKDKVETQPWFIEKVDDGFDPTYCDIYARIKEVKG